MPNVTRALIRRVSEHSRRSSLSEDGEILASNKIKYISFREVGMYPRITATAKYQKSNSFIRLIKRDEGQFATTTRTIRYSERTYGVRSIARRDVAAGGKAARVTAYKIHICRKINRVFELI